MNSSCRENHLVFYILHKSISVCFTFLIHPFKFPFFWWHCSNREECIRMGPLFHTTFGTEHYLPHILKLGKDGYSVIAIIICESGIDNRGCFQPTNSVCWIFALVSAELRAVTGEEKSWQFCVLEILETQYTWASRVISSRVTQWKCAVKTAYLKS